MAEGETMKEIKTKYVDTTATCACGNVMNFKSTKETLQVETCRACHPQYTGKQTAAKQTGAIEKFNARLAKKEK